MEGDRKDIALQSEGGGGVGEGKKSLREPLNGHSRRMWTSSPQLFGVRKRKNQLDPAGIQLERIWQAISFNSGGDQERLIKEKHLGKRPPGEGEGGVRDHLRLPEGTKKLIYPINEEKGDHLYHSSRWGGEGLLGKRGNEHHYFF